MSQYFDGYFRTFQNPHLGVDISAVYGAPVLAAADGRVSEARHGFEMNVVPPWECGALIVIAHADDYFTLYCHLWKSTVRAGQEVRRGDTIGYVATMLHQGQDRTHLHFEVRRYSRFGPVLDPEKLIVGCFGHEKHASTPGAALALTWPVKC